MAYSGTETAAPKRRDRNGGTETAGPRWHWDRDGGTETAGPKRRYRNGGTEVSLTDFFFYFWKDQFQFLGRELLTRYLLNNQ